MLTDVRVRKAKARGVGYRLTDGGGLHLFVAPTGTRTWRYRYEFDGKEKLLTIGPYPSVGLAEARSARDDAREHVRAGRDPMTVKRQRKVEAEQARLDTFERVAREWHALQAPTWSERHAADVIASLERDVFPTIGDLPIRGGISAPVVLAMLRVIERREARETARRIRQRVSAVFVFGIGAGVCDSDPAAVVQKAMAPLIKGRQPAITDLDEARKMLAAAEASPAHPGTKLALRLLALTATRPGTLIEAPWVEFEDIDPAEPIWQIPAARMKLRRHYKDDEARDHLVPLSRQAVAVIEAARKLSGRGPYVFPNGRSARKPLSENAIGYLLNRAGYHHRHVPHGWRATFSTVMNERYPADRHVIDLMLAHVPDNKVEGAYNRAAHLHRRRELAQIWADLITAKLPPPESLLSLPRR